MFVGLSLQLSSSLATATPLNTETTLNKTPKQVVFIDSSIKNYRDLIADTRTNALSGNTLLITLDATSSPIQQISQTLQQYKNIDAIHLITHGFSGGLKLGNEKLVQSTINTKKNQFSQWGKSLSIQGDILLYGCNIAKGKKGKDFIQALAKATQADVIASNNISGNPSENQDWLLEESTGKIETASLIPNNSNNRFQASLDIFNGNAFLYGDHIEVGIGSDGAFGSTVDSPAGYFAGKPVGYISDPSKNKFANGYNGDFFMAGIQEEGWAITLNGEHYNNNRNSQFTDIEGTLSDFKSTNTTKKVTWKGTINGLDITQDYRIYNTGLAIIIDVSLKNTTATKMTDVYYMRTVDPDNNAEQHLNDPNRYVTTNTIIRQGSAEGGAAVTATQADGSILGLCSHGSNSRVVHGGPVAGRREIFYRNPVEVYNGIAPLKTTGTTTEDQPMGIAFKFDTIYPNQTVKFRLGYQLADIKPFFIDIDTNNSSGAEGKSYTQAYKLGDTATNITDTDISFIDLSAQTLLAGATIKLANAQTDDKLFIVGNLPAGITLDANEVNNDIEINLTGVASSRVYQEALQKIVFENKNTTALNETRIISISVLDENFTPSLSAESFIEIITPITLTQPKISGDDIINKAEENNIVLSGTAAPNTPIEVIFSDKDGKKVIKNIVTDDNGNWTIINSPADLTGLADGLIKVEVISTDANGNKSSLTKDINKDATIILSDITPDNNQVIADSNPTISGKSDPNATITFKLTPSGKEYTTQADKDGNWSFTLPNLPLGTTTDIEIIAKDEAGNTTSTTRKIITPALPLEVDNLDVDGTGVATSTTPVFSGTGKAGTTIIIKIPTTGDNSKTCTTTIDSDGKWSCEFSELPSGGPYTATITTKDKAGNKTSTTKDLTIPEVPLIIDSPSDNAVISGATPTIKGTSTPNTTVTVTASTGQQCTAVTDDTNHWSCDLPTLPLDESFTLTITTEDSAGNKTTKTINISTDKLPLSVLTPGDKGTAGDSTPSFIGTSTPDTKITITVSTGVKCETVTDADGNWTCELPAMPVGGPYDITIKAEDSNGNVTTISESISIPKIPLVITSPSSDEVFTGSNMTITGTSDPDTDIIVLGPDGEICKTTTDATGKWSCEIHNLQDGKSKYFTVISGNNEENQKVAILTLDVSNSSEKVNTILNGGGGNFSLLMIMLLGLGALARKTILKR